MCAIEFRLRAMQFSAVDSFLPTAAHVVLMKEDPAQFDVEMRIRRLPGFTTGEYEYLGYLSGSSVKFLEPCFRRHKIHLKIVRLPLCSAVVAVDESLVLVPSFYCQ